ncbi:hypothetical protein TWF696_006331 [Orbilia brochopaga]|uniref:ADF-H domain-containing protein n=1 Tax=Orbilia brochopaga TaxID=3140254 RepID=A0AAV9UZ08_9PEZI
MALNGLDAQVLKDAFDYACSEPGWFLMKYETRDDIALLGKGASAVKDMRDLISKQPDDSPIYGFIRYRRRNILIKLVPENTSRVLKARSQVHFQSVIERFSPCDVTVSLKSYRELTDAALTTACSTHTATASISSSSSSLRQRRLTDIQETSEEGLEAQDSEQSKAESKVVENQQGLQVIVTTHDPGVSSDGKRAPIEVEISASEPMSIEPVLEEFPLPDTVGDDDQLSIVGGGAGGLSRSDSFARDPRVSESEGFGRKSTSRPTAEDIYAELALKYQPKVKLGPRPSADWNRRPHTSSSVSSGPASEKSGPTSSVPKNIHLPARMGTRKARSGSQSSSSSKLQFLERASSPSPASNKGSLRHPGPPPLQFASANIAPPNSFPSAPLSPTPSFASFKSTHSTFSLSTPIGAASAANAGSSSSSSLISLEKARLMKALELRKKALSQQQQSAAATTTHLKSAEELSGPPPQPGAFRSSSPARRASATSMIMMASPLAAISSTSSSSSSTNSHPTRVSSTDGIAIAMAAGAAAAAVGSPPNSSSSSSSISPPSEPASLENSVPDTPTQDSYAATSEPAAATALETTVPSPTQAPSTSTERDSQKSYSDDLDKESESSYAVSDLNGESLESNTITDDGDDRLATRLHPPPPTLLLPTPKASPLEPEPIKKKQTPPPPEPTPKTYEEPKRDDTPPRSPLLHLNMLAPKAPADYMESQKLPKAHHRLPSDVPVIETARSVSAPFLNNQEKKQVMVSSRKVSVSSSVSQRIKALEMLSNKPGAMQAPLTPQRSRPSSPTPQFPPLRANSLKTSASSPNLTPLPGPSAVPALSSITRVESPFLNKKNTDELVTNGRSFALPPLGSYSASKSRTGSFGEISIVPSRKASVSSLNISTIAEPDPMPSKDSSSSAGTSPTEKKSKMPPLLRRMSSAKSPKKSPTPSIASPLSTPVTPAVKTSPILKSTPVLPKTAPAAAAPAPTPAPAQPVKTTLLTGWVNVQLPDTMLWKRRYIKIESDNWLYLTNSADEGSGLTGKYNIRTDVQAAVVPDIDEQELPNSVNLRLREGGVLACACENQQEQNKILKVVRSCIA